MAAEKRLAGELPAKVEKLRELLKTFRTVAVAFSGGVDSTVLLHNVCEVFPPEKIQVFNVTSCLVSEDASIQAVNVFKEHFTGKCTLETIQMDPLGWDGFSENSSERCYVCKTNIYSHLLGLTRRGDIEVLLDGTNLDDLGQDRPGYRAILELGVRAPLAETKLTKNEIRAYARDVGLINADTPSNSCLATRLQRDVPISLTELKKIEAAEAVLIRLGISGCRVRIDRQYAYLEVQEDDIARVAEKQLRSIIFEQFGKIGLGSVCLVLKGR